MSKTKTSDKPAVAGRTGHRQLNLSTDPIRIETNFSRFPVHNLAKRGRINIEITEKTSAAAIAFRWEVSYNARYGQPGPLAYKVDSLIVNKRIDEAVVAGRSLPKLIRLGSLAGICEELEVADSGRNRSNIRRAIYQNAFAAINAKISYVSSDRSERHVEFGSTRYAVIFTGERLPSGGRADAVYILLNDLYRDLLSQSLRRPLDYNYLRSLPPAPQRFYELVSYQIYAAIKYRRARAKITYSELCLYAPQVRYYDFDHVKKQMYKITNPHRRSNYIAKVDYELGTDAEGNPDWNIYYTPGERARAEYRVFTDKNYRLSFGGADATAVQVPDVKTEIVEKNLDSMTEAVQAAVKTPDKPDDLLTEEQSDMLDRLTLIGISEVVAREFVVGSLEVAKRQLAALPFQKCDDKARFLVAAIKNDYRLPQAYAEAESKHEQMEKMKRNTKASKECRFCQGRNIHMIVVDERQAGRKCTHDEQVESSYKSVTY